MTTKDLYKESFDKLAAYGMSELNANSIIAKTSETQTHRPAGSGRKFKRHAVVLAAVLCILLIGTTVFAAVNGFFTRGLSGLFQADSYLQQMLLDSGIATVFDESDAITVDDITIQPTVMLTDGGRLYLAFKVRDYDTGEYIRPEFSKHVEVSIYDGKDLKTDNCTGGAMGFYAETIPQGASASDEISDNPGSEFGLQFSDYYDSEHNLEYIINVSAERPIFGQTVRVEFNGLSTYNNRRSTESNNTETLTGTYWAANTVEGPWVFDIKVPDKSEKTDSVLRTIYFEDNEPVWKGVYIDSIDITPLRITVHAKATDEAESIKYYHIDDWYEYDRTGITVTKIKLKNGEVIDYANDRIIDPQEIQAIYIKERTQKFSEEVIGEENYYSEEILVELS